jgi:dihydrofolate reductase
MRKVVISMLISLDGFHEGPGKDVMALPFDDGFSPYNAERLRNADTQFYGRRSFEGAQSYWPQIADDEKQPPIEREISRLNNAIEKIVVSDSLQLDPVAPWTSTTRVVSRSDASREFDALRQEDGGDILAFGSVTTWSALLEAGVVDELHVLVGPSLLGAGSPLYNGSARVPLRLLETRRLPDSQLVLLRYDVTGVPRRGDATE